MLPDFEKGLYGRGRRRREVASRSSSRRTITPKTCRVKKSNLRSRCTGRGTGRCRTRRRVREAVQRRGRRPRAVASSPTSKRTCEREAEQRSSAERARAGHEGLLDANPIEIPKALKAIRRCSRCSTRPCSSSASRTTSRRRRVENFAEGADKRVRLGLLMRQLIDDRDRTRSRRGYASPRRGNVRRLRECRGDGEPTCPIRRSCSRSSRWCSRAWRRLAAGKRQVSSRKKGQFQEYMNLTRSRVPYRHQQVEGLHGMTQKH